jgi:hypothetical protein
MNNREKIDEILLTNFIWFYLLKIKKDIFIIYLIYYIVRIRKNQVYI